MPSNRDSTKVEQPSFTNEDVVVAEIVDKEISCDVIVQKQQNNEGESKLAIIQSMIKQIRNGTPIYRVQLPIFLQEPRSLLERYGDFCSHMDIFNSVADILDPEQRFLAIVKFYLSGWHARPKELRNPFNPILGEVFKCKYEHADSTTEYTAEQISHHPPSSAFSVINEKKGMYLTAYIRPSFKFKGNSLESILHGRIAGHCKQHKEDYEIEFPHFAVRGLLIGALNLQLCGTAKISCPQTGYSAEMEFRSKGFFTGKPNYVFTQVKHVNHKKPIYTIEGRWDEVLTIVGRKGKPQIFIDVQNTPSTRATVAPLNQQAENESRRVWGKVIQNISSNREMDALKEKTAVEEHQRELDRERKANNSVWSPSLFVKVNEDYYVHKSLMQLSPIFSS